MHNIDFYFDLRNKRVDPNELANKLCSYDIISFDVFDTLILRPFTSPRVLFSIMEQRLGIYKFSKIRVDSEDELRCLKKLTENHDNVTQLEIYNLIARKTNIDPNYAANLEYELELNYCFANPYFSEVISILRENKKKVIAISDMYLSSKQITGILIKSGYELFSDVFVSSEYSRSKKDGGLYELVKEKNPNKNIIHIGDNYIADIENAKKIGFDTFFYKNVNEISSKMRVAGMSYLTGRAYSALINNHLYSTHEEYCEPYKLGYIYGGIYILGFVQWVNKFVQNHHVDKILFLARDGDIYSKMYNKLPCRKEWEYFYWSRLAGMKVIALENFYEFCTRMIWHKARGVYNIKVSHLLDFYDISFLADKLKGYDLSNNDIMSKETAPKIENLFYDNKQEIIQVFKKDIEATFLQVKKSIGNAKSVAIVDVGWAGTGPLTIRNIINNYLRMDTKVYSLLAGYRQPFQNMASIYTMDDTVHAYLFSDTLNRDLMDYHTNYGTKKNNLLLELFSQSCTPSFLGYKDGFLEFDYEDYENYQIVNEINKGTESFVDSYLRFFKSDPFMLNVSAYDAYLPFNELKNSQGKLDFILGKMIISRGKFYDAEKKSHETWLSFFSKDD